MVSRFREMAAKERGRQVLENGLCFFRGVSNFLPTGANLRLSWNESTQ
jgi:hypothetical protein